MYLCSVLGATTFSIMTQRRTTLRLTIKNATLSVMTLHTYADCCYKKCSFLLLYWLLLCWLSWHHVRTSVLAYLVTAVNYKCKFFIRFTSVFESNFRQTFSANFRHKIMNFISNRECVSFTDTLRFESAFQIHLTFSFYPSTLNLNVDFKVKQDFNIQNTKNAPFK